MTLREIECEASIPPPTRRALDYDGQGNLTALTDPLGGVWSMSFNADNLATSLINPAGVAVWLSYDAHQALIQARFADQTTLSSTRDSLGNVGSRTNRRGHAVQCTRDPHGLLTRRIRRWLTLRFHL